MDRKNIEKIAQTPDDRMLLAKLWDKIQPGITKNIFVHSGFLSPRQLQMVNFLFGNPQGLYYFGGYDDAERKMIVYLPDYLDESVLSAEDGPIVCLEASFYKRESLSHRDFLGALMGCGITRESIGDILVGDHVCYFFTTLEMSAYILQNFDSAGRVHISLQQVSLDTPELPKPKFSEHRDTVSSLRLDSIISAGFSISRSSACQHITAGGAAINGLGCEKVDRVIAEGDKISLRGLGKISLAQVGHTTKKGRISVVIHRYE